MTQTETDAVLRFVRDIHVPCGLDEAPSRISTALSQLIPCLSGGYGVADPRTGAISVSLDRGELNYSPDEVGFIAHHLDEVPYIDLQACLDAARSAQPWSTRSEARMSSDYQSRREFRETGVYREVYRAKGIEYLLLLPTMSLAPDWVGGFGLQREVRDFSHHERELLELVQPHIMAALRNAVTWTRLSQVPEGMCTVLARPDGRVAFATECARRWLAHYFGPLRGQRLPDALATWMSAARKAGVAPPVMPMRVAGQGGVLEVRCVPASREDDLEMLVLSEAPGAQDSGSVRLSERELEVLDWISEAKTNEEIAAILGVSVNTIRTHVKNILAKLGVENRTAAATWALSHR